MLDPESHDSEPRPHHTSVPKETETSEDPSALPGLDRLLRHSRIERFIRRMFPDQRKYERFLIPHVVAYLGNAHASRPHQVANISVGGFCILSGECWTPGTEMPITLQREEWDGEESAECASVQAIVARCGRGEVGFSIALTPEESSAFSVLRESGLWISKTAMEQFLENLKKPKVQRLLLVDCPRERPLPIAQRTERLLEIARLHSLSTASELFYKENR